jgi:hypothetical protein
MKPESQVFSHSGDVGDLIYALASIKTMGGGWLRLVRVDRRFKVIVREPFSPGKVELLRRFLEAQPYVAGVEYGETYAGVNLDQFRKNLRYHISLCDAVAETFGIPRYPRNESWLSCVDPNPVAPVVISRSSRHHNYDGLWPGVREKYDDVVFVGLPEEHAAWQSQFGEVRYQATADWWELCRVIAGARIFVGNQSAPMALALGLCVPQIVQEVYLSSPNCYFDRPGVHYFPDHPLGPRTGREVLPDL